MASGERSATMDGLIKMQLWSAGSLAISKEAIVLWDGTR